MQRLATSFARGNDNAISDRASDLQNRPNLTLRNKCSPDGRTSRVCSDRRSSEAIHYIANTVVAFTTRKKKTFIRNTVYRHARVYNVSAIHGKMLQLYILLAHNTVSTHTCKVTRIALHLYSPIHISHIELSMCRAPSGVSMWRTAHSD